MTVLRDYGPFADISASYVNDIVVALLVIVPTIGLKPPFEELGWQNYNSNLAIFNNQCNQCFK